MQEETGVCVSEQDLRSLVTVSHEYVDRKVRIHFFAIELRSEQMPARGEWVAADQLNQRRVPEANRVAIDLVLQDL